MNFLKTKIIVISLITVILTVAAVFTSVKQGYHHYILFFKNSRTGCIEAEMRYVPKDINKDYSLALVEELILGPVNNDAYPFMSPNTEIKACFIRDGIMHINFPEEILEEVSMQMEFYEFFQLFKKNIAANCKTVDKINMYLNGVQIYELFYDKCDENLD